MTFHNVQQFNEFAGRALDGKGKLTQLARGNAPTIVWDISGNCSNPGHRELRTAKPLSGGEARKGGQFGIVKSQTSVRTIELKTRCRKCDGCLRVRAYQWRQRATQEYANSVRTWFGTITLSAEAQFKAISRARLRLDQYGIDFDNLSRAEQFAERHREIGPELTKYIKRVRKESGASIRYILVAEAHKSGAPHYHVLIHERSGPPVRHSCLTRQWHLGFTKFNLVKDKGAAGYVCKYLSKSASARVRASAGYGLDSLQTNILRSSVETPHVDTHRPTSLNHISKVTEHVRISNRIPSGCVEVRSTGGPIAEGFQRGDTARDCSPAWLGLCRSIPSPGNQGAAHSAPAHPRTLWEEGPRAAGRRSGCEVPTEAGTHDRD